MKGKGIYYGIIILGVGAITYMYYLSDAGSKSSDAGVIDELVKEGNLKG